LKTTPNNKSVCTFNLAVNRGGKEKEKADFIECVSWNNQAENLVKYQRKGSKIAVDGQARMDQYKDKDGKTVYRFYILANNIEFLDTKKEAKTEEVEDDLPF